MSAEATTPQPDAAAASDAGPTIESPLEIPVDGIESLDVHAPTGGDTPAAETENKSTPEGRARDFQARWDRLDQKVGKNLLEFIERAGNGDNAAILLNQYEQALNHPTMGPAIRSFQLTGNVDFGTPNGEVKEPEEDFRDPLEVKLTDQIGELQEQIAQLSSATNGFAADQGAEMIGRFTTEFLDEYPMTDAQKQEFHQALDAKIAAMSSTHGAHLLKNMNRDGYKALVLPIIEPFRADIWTRQQQATKSGLQAMATDAPVHIPTQVTAENHNPTSPPRNFRDAQERARRAVREALKGA